MNARASTKRLVSAAVLAAAAIIAVVIYRAGLNEILPPPTGSTVLEQAIGIGTHGTQNAWHFRAKRIVTSADGSLTTLEGVESAALYKSGKAYLELHADRVTINTRTRDLTVNGHIQLRSANEPIVRTLQTDVITWNNALQLLSIPSATTLTSQGDRLTIGNVQWNVATGQITANKIDGTAKL
ncbi:hypothetical protein EPN44_03090 [bacterium]|nr:MAG: hypothetical protein EPN44_03090 [bacterium]